MSKLDKFNITKPSSYQPAKDWAKYHLDILEASIDVMGDLDSMNPNLLSSISNYMQAHAIAAIAYELKAQRESKGG